jgi:hypothetical protein
MGTFLIVFGILAALAAYAIRTTREIDRMEEAEWEYLDDRHKMEMCRETILDDVCGYRCGSCPWHVPDEDAERAAEGVGPYETEEVRADDR